jgi:DNA-binding beta-propeller fold protein YncE
MPHMGGPSGHVHPIGYDPAQLFPPFGDVPEAWGFDFVGADRLLIASPSSRQVISLDLDGSQFVLFDVGSVYFAPPPPRDIAVLPDQSVVVTADNLVIHLDALGAHLGEYTDGDAMGGDTVGVDWHDDGYLVVVAHDGVFRVPAPGTPPEPVVDAMAAGIPFPQFVDIGPTGLLYVSNHGNDDVVEIDPNTGVVLRRFGEGLLVDPLGVLVN